jgi:hypothetical protein
MPKTREFRLPAQLKKILIENKDIQIHQSCSRVALWCFQFGLTVDKYNINFNDLNIQSVDLGTTKDEPGKYSFKVDSFGYIFYGNTFIQTKKSLTLILNPPGNAHKKVPFYGK